MIWQFEDVVPSFRTHTAPLPAYLRVKAVIDWTQSLAKEGECAMELGVRIY